MHNTWVHSRYDYINVILNFLISHPCYPIKSKSGRSLLIQPTSYQPHCLSRHLQVSYRVFCSSIIATSNSVSAASMSNAEHKLNHIAPLPKHLQWFTTAFSVKTRTLRERLLRPEY